MVENRFFTFLSTSISISAISLAVRPTEDALVYCRRSFLRGLIEIISNCIIHGPKTRWSHCNKAVLLKIRRELNFFTAFQFQTLPFRSLIFLLLQALLSLLQVYFLILGSDLLLELFFRDSFSFQQSLDCSFIIPSLLLLSFFNLIRATANPMKT